MQRKQPDNYGEMDMEVNGQATLVEQHAPHMAPEELKAEAQQRRGPTFEGVDAAELAGYVNEDIDWVVDWVLAADQPTIFGAGSKVGKTTQLVDLSVALATQTDWLGEFRIPKRRRVLFITGEAGRRAISKRIQRALDARELDWKDLEGWLRVEAIDFPTLPSPDHQDAVSATVKKHSIDVVIVDPLYRGLRGVDTKTLSEMGDAIVSFAKCCEPASLVVSHHTTKTAAREAGPPALESLSGAGLAESCGNWWLIGRNEPYKFDRIHDLVVTYGGRDEQAGIKRIVFDESDWTFDVRSGGEIQESKKQEAAAEKQERRDGQLSEAQAEIKHSLTNETQYRPKLWIQDRCSSPRAIFRKAMADLIDDCELSSGEYLDERERKTTGWGLTDNRHLPHLPTLAGNVAGECGECRDDGRRRPSLGEAAAADVSPGVSPIKQTVAG